MTIVYRGIPESEDWPHVGLVMRERLDHEGKPIGRAKVLNPWKYGSDGFAWGYSGTGPSALALAILHDATDDRAWAEERGRYHQFKEAFIATLNDGPWTIESAAVLFWAKDNGWTGWESAGPREEGE